MVTAKKSEGLTPNISEKNNVTIIRSASSSAQVNAWSCRKFR